VTAFRIALAPALHAYADAGYITHEQADAVVHDVYGVTVQLESNIDLRLKGNTR
jgi:hypothetical protein